MSKVSGDSEKNMLNKFGRAKTRLNIFFLETLYEVHVHIRYAHDKIYERGGAYKRYSDSPVSGQVHKASAYAFLVSFFAFTVLQTAFPYFFTMKPRQAQAGQDNVVWSSFNDFNAATPKTTVTINGQTPNADDDAAGNVQLAANAGTVTLDYGDGSDGPLDVTSGTTTINTTKTTLSANAANAATSITVSNATGFAANQDILIIQMKDVNGSTYSQLTGTWAAGQAIQEEKEIESVVGNTINLKTALARPNISGQSYNYPATYTQIIKIMQYSSVSVTGTGTAITAPAHDGSTGGILNFKSPSVTVGSGASIHMNGRGYITGPGMSGDGGGMGGGGYGTAGSINSWGYGTGGPSYGAYPALPALGSGGGGASGGGLIIIQTSSPTIDGNILANGGTSSTVSAGGGSGGGIYFLSSSSVNLSKFSNSGGAGGPNGGGDCDCDGGSGGVGRITVQAATTSGAPVGGISTSITPYPTSGTLGGSGASDVGLRKDVGAGINARWGSVAFNSSALVSGQAVKFAIRTSDDGTTWSALKGRDGNAIDWTTGTGNYLGQAYGESVYSAISGVSSTRYIDIMVQLVSYGGDTPTLNDVTLTYNTLDAPTALSQTDARDNTISANGWTNSSTANLIFNGTPTSTGNVTPEVVIKSVDAGGAAPSFSSADTATTTNVSAPVVAGTADVELANLTATVSSLTPGKDYYWKARYSDSAGVVSPWSTNAVKFSVEQTAPTVGSFTINSGATYASASTRIITANGIFNDTGGSSGTLQVQFSENGTDWGVYSGSGTTNNKATDWTYSTTKTASGSSQDITNAWYLEGADGSKTVYVRTKDAAGNVSGSAIDTSQADFSGTATDTTVYSDGKIELSLVNDTGTGVDGALVVDGATNGSGNPLVLSGTKNYTSVTLQNNAYVTTSAYNGTAGGQLTLKIQGILSIEAGSVLYADGKGYRQADASTGRGGAGASNYYICDDDQVGGGGGGGGYGTVGIVGNPAHGCQGSLSAPGGTAGFTYGTDLADQMGSAGNKGGDTWDSTEPGGAGGAGGGKLIINANTINVSGTIRSNGSNGSVGAGYLPSMTGGGGGGSGGGIALLANSVTLNSGSQIKSLGGTGGADAFHNNNGTGGSGGAGGKGRIYVGYTSLTNNATIDPAPTTALSTPYKTSGNYLSPIKNSGSADPIYGDINFSTLGSGVTVKFIAGDQANLSDAVPAVPDATWSNISAVTSGSSLSSFVGKQYYRYRVEFTGDGTGTGTLNDVTIEVNNGTSDTITLDAQGPAAFELSGPADGTWQTSANPTLSWNASSDGNGLSKYMLFVDGELDTDLISNASTSQATTASLAEGNHTWYVKAIDIAGNETSSTSTWDIGYDSAVPSAVSGLSATEDNAADVTVTWTAYSDSGSPITNYKIQRVLRTEYTSLSLTPTNDWSGAPSIAQITCGATTSLIETAASITGTGCVKDSGEYISEATAYYYRIAAKDTANVDYGAWSAATDQGMTRDTVDPTSPSNVQVLACDGTNNCSAVSGITHKGYELKITWNPASDSGSGIANYKIWRTTVADSIDQNDYDLVGVSGSFPSPETVQWYDNDANNVATETFYDVDDTVTPSISIPAGMKTEASTSLADYGTYYYRVTAVDAADIGNESDFVPNIINNYNSGRTDDISNPTISQITGVTANSITELQVDWPNWQDKSDRDATVNGSGVAEYVVERSYNGTDWAVVTDNDGNTANNQFVDHNYDDNDPYGDPEAPNDRFQGLTDYFYRIKARDVAGNWTGYTTNTDNSKTTTPDATAPSAPTLVNASATKGNNASDSNVGHRVTLTWTGSEDNGQVVGYKIYRSTDGTLTTNQWLALTPIKTITNADSGFSNLPIADDTGNQRTYADSGLTDATTYYYRIVAYDNVATPLNSALSATSTPTTKSFEITPDDTAPAIPADVKIQAIWGANSGDIRMVVTWQKIATPTRNGSNDFKEYRLYKSTDNVTFEQLKVNDLNPLYNANKTVAMESNYYVDSAVLSDGTQYYYYVTAVDDAETEFKYTNPPFDNTNVINAVSNESGQSAKVELNPSLAQPEITTLSNGKKAEVRNVGVSSATIYWVTNQATESVVAYRKSGTNDSFVTTGTEGMSTTHSVTLPALEAGTAYEYRVSGKNNIGNDKKAGYGQADSGIGDTNTGNDDVPTLTTSSFSISNVNVSVTTTTATVAWTTNIGSDSNVEFKREARAGEAAEESKTAGDPKLDTSHEVVIKALRPDTNYTYKVRSVTGDKFISETAFLTFKTKPYDASQFTITPNASSVAEQNITATSAKIVWNTAVATTSWLDYGTASGAYNQSAGDNGFNTVHVVELLNLTPGNTYYYKVRGKDSNDIEYTSQEYSFSAVLLPQILNPKVADLGHYSATITWDTNVDASSFIAYGKDTSYGAGVGKNEFARNHSSKLENLEDNSTYHYQITVKDKLGNEIKSDDLTFSTPIDTTGPEVKEVKIDILPMGTDDETASAIISWTTNKPATTQVEYDEGVLGGKYGKRSVEDASLNTAHTVIIKDLNPSATYHFHIVSKDKRENKTNSQDYTFVTPTKEKSVLQLIIRSLEETFSWVSQMPRYFKGLGQRITGR